MYQPKSEKQTEDIEPKSGYRELGFRTVGKPDCISNTDSINNKDLYKGNIKSCNVKQRQYDYSVIPKSSPRYDVKTLINEEIFGSN